MLKELKAAQHCMVCPVSYHLLIGESPILGNGKTAR